MGRDAAAFARKNVFDNLVTNHVTAECLQLTNTLVLPVTSLKFSMSVDSHLYSPLFRRVTLASTTMLLSHDESFYKKPTFTD